MDLNATVPRMTEKAGSIWKHTWASLVAQMVRSQPAVQDSQIQWLGWEDPLEKEMATHSIILAWRIPWAEEPGRLHSKGS